MNYSPPSYRSNIPHFSQKLGVSEEALQIYTSTDVIDLHIDTFIWNRILNYNLDKRHGPGFFGNNFFWHLDFPRAREANLTGGMWSITTNPFKPAQIRKIAFLNNLKKFREIFHRPNSDLMMVKNHSEYIQAQKDGKHAVMLSVQGGNCFGDDFSGLNELDNELLRITLIHFTKSLLGTSSLKSKERKRGLTNKGKEFVKILNEKKIFVDLAHIHEDGFWDALDVHSNEIPPLVTHTGVKGVCDHWRNLTDDQVKAIADRNGVVGIMFQKYFLDHKKSGHTIERIVDHIEHAIKIGGENVVALGSDFDGVILPPKGLDSVLDLPKIVQVMLNRKWTPERIQKVLGKNFLRVFKELRP